MRAGACLMVPLIVVPLMLGCATSGGTVNPRDPLEPINRATYQFNDTVDRYAIKPVAQAYQRFVPQPVQLVVTNFFSNLGDLWTGANNLLQAKPKDALVDVSRFVLNSTLGFVGFADVASAVGMPKHQEDFGQTLGYWGVASGPYLVIPFLGPSTIRDAPALYVDFQGNPLAWVGAGSRERNILLGLNVINGRALLLEAERLIAGAALDRYSLIRDGWLQRRRNAVYDGNPPEEPALEDDSGYSDGAAYPDDSGQPDDRPTGK